MSFVRWIEARNLQLGQVEDRTVPRDVEQRRQVETMLSSVYSQPSRLGFICSINLAVSWMKLQPVV